MELQGKQSLTMMARRKQSWSKPPNFQILSTQKEQINSLLVYFYFHVPVIIMPFMFRFRQVSAIVFLFTLDQAVFVLLHVMKPYY